MSTREFLARVPERLAAHPCGSPEYEAEKAKINSEVAADVAAAIADERQRMESDLAAKLAQAKQLSRDREAHAIVAPLAHDDACAQVMRPYARDRISVEDGASPDDPFRHTYLDAGGNPTTRAALQAEIRAAPQFQRLVRGGSPEERAAHQRRVALVLREKPPKVVH